MSQPGTGRQPPPAAPAAHGDKKASGASSKSGEKKAEEAEKKPASANVSQPPKTQTSGAPSAVKKQSPSVDASKPQIMKPSETKSAPTTKTESGKKTQSTKPTDSQNKQPSEERQKEPDGAKSQTSPSVTTSSKPNNTGKLTTTQADHPPQATTIETAKPKSEKMSIAAGAAGAGAAGASVVAAADKSSAEPGMDESALDSLIDTLGGPEEDVPPSPVYTGPEVTEDITSRYLEEMGKREGSLPPEYVKLLKSKGKDGVPPKGDERDEKPMTDDELAEALSSDFTCTTASAEEKKTSLTEKPSKEGEIVQAQAASSVKTSVPPKEKKTKSKEEIKDDAVEALLDTLGGPEPEPEEDLTPVVEVSEAKAKEKKEEKTGEREDTIPPEFRLTPQLDKDGKPLLPKPEEKSQPMSEDDLLEGLTEGFSCSPSPSAPLPTPTVIKKTKESKKPADSSDIISAATASSVHSAAPLGSTSGGKEMDEALDLLSDSLGQREPDPDENKPVVDKVKEKAKSEHRDKVGERDDTIPPDYQKLLESGEQGKPVKPTAKDDVKHKKKPTDDSAAIDALSGDFDTCAKAPATPQHSKCRTKVERKPSPLKQPQRIKENPKTLKRQRDSPPAANLRSRKQAKR
ncbi:calpastatin isoform X7 [Gymnogyps californianus]|uniref:calpastatin isoform X7 n=1 Tax=Gymnogyps californianus TaxID=33616 RepID=UPI0021C90ECE|nr:calpastatin isoform X7 [Gymnogyps californianus]